MNHFDGDFVLGIDEAGKILYCFEEKINLQEQRKYRYLALNSNLLFPPVMGKLFTLEFMNFL